MPKSKSSDKSDAAQDREVAPEPSLAGVGPDDPTYQARQFDTSRVGKTPEERRDAVLADQENYRKNGGV